MSPIDQHIVILGGGTAGLLTANIIAVEFDPAAGIHVTLIESPTTPTIGVGEGAWPSMRSALMKIGISERTFIDTCPATLKQGTRFEGWQTPGVLGDIYYHPFTLPHGFQDLNLAEFWDAGLLGTGSFAKSVTPQVAACEAGKAPKQIQVPEYAFTLNYGYLRDAGKFAELLRNNATQRLGVNHLLADMTSVRTMPTGDIEVLETSQGVIPGELFVDRSGFVSLLLGEHYGVPVNSQRDVLFNDSALAVQVPYSDVSDSVATTAHAAAHHAGWFWGIGLQHRRGVGAVFSSRHTDRDSVEAALDQYLLGTGHAAGLKDSEPRLITFDPGYRQQFGHRNCVAIGLSAGFIEPLEASALVLVEPSARRLAEQLPTLKANMSAAANDFNREFNERWQQIIEFLKLHCVLSERDDTAYWRAHPDPDSIPSRLQQKLDGWRYRCPWHQDERRVDEMFPAASYQYMLCEMGFQSEVQPSVYRGASSRQQKGQELGEEIQRRSNQYLRHLPIHWSSLDQVNSQGFATRTSA